jgi:DNA-binding beta-propeller fold protein YncE
LEKEISMKRLSIVLLLLFGAAPRAQQSTPPEIPFESVANFLKLPRDMNFGENAGVAVNSRGNVFVFTRGNVTGPAFGATAAQLLEFGPDGKYIREIGKGLYAMAYAHAVRVDRDDNIWIIDKGSDMVVKFNPEGHAVMIFGRKKESSDEAEPWSRTLKPPLPPVNGMFRQPTDVTWNAQGDIFISDGYVNSRVAKYDRNGDWVKSFGEPGSGPGQLNVPHSIASDASGNIYVADRGNNRIQVFDGDGKVLRQIKINVPPPPGAQPVIGNPADPDAAPSNQTPGTPWAICITPGPNQFLYAADAFPGRIYKLDLQGNVLGMLGRAGRQLKQFGWIHEIACPSENELYVAEIINWRVQKLLLRPERGVARAAR